MEEWRVLKFKRAKAPWISGSTPITQLEAVALVGVEAPFAFNGQVRESSQFSFSWACSRAWEVFTALTLEALVESAGFWVFGGGVLWFEFVKDVREEEVEKKKRFAVGLRSLEESESECEFMKKLGWFSCWWWCGLIWKWNWRASIPSKPHTVRERQSSKNAGADWEGGEEKHKK